MWSRSETLFCGVGVGIPMPLHSFAWMHFLLSDIYQFTWLYWMIFTNWRLYSYCLQFVNQSVASGMTLYLQSYRWKKWLHFLIFLQLCLSFLILTKWVQFQPWSWLEHFSFHVLFPHPPLRMLCKSLLSLTWSPRKHGVPSCSMNDLRLGTLDLGQRLNLCPWFPSFLNIPK